MLVRRFPGQVTEPQELGKRTVEEADVRVPPSPYITGACPGPVSGLEFPSRSGRFPPCPGLRNPPGDREAYFFFLFRKGKCWRKLDSVTPEAFSSYDLL